MSFQESPDAPTYRGKTLTPESPRPVYIPEPGNIPVLENQIDPVFNLMSTHMTPPHSARNMTAMDKEMTQFGAVPDQVPTAVENDISGSSGESQDNGGGDRVQESGQNDEDTVAPDNNEAKQGDSETSLDNNQASSLTDQPSASVASVDILSTSISSNLQPTPSTHIPANDSTEHTEAHEPSLYSPASNEQTTNATEHDAGQVEGDKQEGSSEATTSGAVNYQALLDNIVPSIAADASNLNIPPGSPPKSEDLVDEFTSSSANIPSPNTTVPAGLPPRPPPQEKPAIHPNYVPGEDIRSYHYPHLHGNQPTQSSQQSNSYRPNQSFPHNPTTGSNGLPPPPLASFQQSNMTAGSDTLNSPTQKSNIPAEPSGRKNRGGRNDEGRWAPEVQKIYDQFLDDETVYTAEGTWDKFPQGSRLFVGNLPTEIVTKRDIFHIFHRYGRLAQISIKQAYGFVQFMDTESSQKALRAEQGGKIKDRSMHLEISKPPKNSRNAQPSAAGDKLRAGHYARPRSPDRRPVSRGMRGGDRYGKKDSFGDFRDEPRGRDEYRSRRSPSPRGFRGRDKYRDRSPDYYNGGGRDRSRSPYGRGPRYDRGPSPRRLSSDEDDRLPMMKRNPRDVPEVQLIMMEDLDRAFVGFIEKHMRDRGLTVGTLQMPLHASIDAVTKRQVVEGVQAIIKLFRASQNAGKIPVQLFDRSGGGNQARFENYDELDAHVAAELIIRNKQKQPSLLASQPQFLASNAAYGQQPNQQPQAGGVPPNLSNLFTQLDGPTLQKLVGAMQNTPQTPQSAPLLSPTQNPNFAAMLGNLTQQQNPVQGAGPGYPYQPQSQQQPMQQQQAMPPQQQQQQPQYPYGSYQQPQQPQQQAAQQPQQQYPYPQGGGPPPQHQVQNIMQQLAKWKQ